MEAFESRMGVSELLSDAVALGSRQFSPRRVKILEQDFEARLEVPWDQFI